MYWLKVNRQPKHKLPRIQWVAILSWSELGAAQPQLVLLSNNLKSIRFCINIRLIETLEWQEIYLDTFLIKLHIFILSLYSITYYCPEMRVYRRIQRDPIWCLFNIMGPFSFSFCPKQVWRNKMSNIDEATWQPSPSFSLISFPA